MSEESEQSLHGPVKRGEGDPKHGNQPQNGKIKMGKNWPPQPASKPNLFLSGCA